MYLPKRLLLLLRRVLAFPRASSSGFDCRILSSMPVERKTEKETEKERETDRETERRREHQKETHESIHCSTIHVCVHPPTYTNTHINTYTNTYTYTYEHVYGMYSRCILYIYGVHTWFVLAAGQAWSHCGQIGQHFLGGLGLRQTHRQTDRERDRERERQRERQRVGE